ncbi:glycerophosphodiester phosphodiesterase family protein [uncultured Victivallis sp.]|mgnify:FL=1|uniref:glycerophosphodiester phosphodiesterase n=1 Tax=uncultured Victivallis sp. TaxID=354118 RepID=UPI002591F190|nr:glycerophosphodiester phosphodiesterase family protein [uncultured Victivallis sp.]
MTRFLSHRGESDDAPENTLAAYKLAMERDSDGIELDIRLTADGEAACVHDETIERVSGVRLAVSDSTLAALRQYHPVPLLSEALAVLKPGKQMQIELKGPWPQLQPVKAVLDRRGGDRKGLALSSFEEETIRAAADVFPELPRLLLTDLTRRFGRFPAPEQVVACLHSLRCTGISFLATAEADAAFVEALHRAGMRVVCWGVRSDELGLAMARIGVDAMTCNHAVALRAEYRKRIAG